MHFGTVALWLKIAKLIITSCFGQTRILVTHGVHWLPMVDHVIVLNDGVITDAGSYEELMSRDGHFAQFLKTYLIERDDDEEDPESKQ